jgi:hypothetical protein
LCFQENAHQPLFFIVLQQITLPFSIRKEQNKIYITLKVNQLKPIINEKHLSVFDEDVAI